MIHTPTRGVHDVHDKAVYIVKYCGINANGKNKAEQCKPNARSIRRDDEIPRDNERSVQYSRALVSRGSVSRQGEYFWKITIPSGAFEAFVETEIDAIT